MSIKINRLEEGHNSYPLVCRRPALKETIHKAFSHRNYGSKFAVLGYNSTYFSNKIHKGKTCYSEEQVISMLEFGGYINGRNSANLELLIDKTSSIYLYVKLKALAS
jgi:hypothetical protein